MRGSFTNNSIYSLY